MLVKKKHKFSNAVIEATSIVAEGFVFCQRLEYNFLLLEF